MSKNGIRIGVWRFETSADRESLPLEKAKWEGAAFSFEDLVALSQNRGYLAYTLDRAGSHRITYSEAAALLGINPWFNLAVQSGVLQKLKQIYYSLIFPSTVVSMTLEQFNNWKRVQDTFFSKEYHSFFYMDGKGKDLVVARAHISGIQNNGRAYIWIQKVLHQGTNAQIAADTSFVAHYSNLYLLKNE